MLSRGNSQIAKVDKDGLAVAFKARTILAAFEQPTVAMAVRDMGEEEVLIQMTAAIKRAFEEYFSEGQRMAGELHVSFAETIMDDYPNESVADVVLFIKYAARGKYGETKEVRNDEGEVISRQISNFGKTYGAINTTLAMDWFRQFLGEKAEEIEKARSKELKSMNKNVAHESVWDLVKKVRAETSDEDRAKELDTGKRVARLMRTVAHMGDARLRYAWKKARTERERMVIIQEANKRGLVQKKIEDHLSKLETPKP